MSPNMLGARIRRARKAKGWNQKKLADYCGISNSTISDIELGKVDPKLSHVVRLCLALGIDLK